LLLADLASETHKTASFASEQLSVAQHADGRFRKNQRVVMAADGGGESCFPAALGEARKSGVLQFETNHTGTCFDVRKCRVVSRINSDPFFESWVLQEFGSDSSWAVEVGVPPVLKFAHPKPPSLHRNDIAFDRSQVVHVGSRGDSGGSSSEPGAKMLSDLADVDLSTDRDGSESMRDKVDHRATLLRVLDGAEDEMPVYGSSHNDGITVWRAEEGAVRRGLLPVEFVAEADCDLSEVQALQLLKLVTSSQHGSTLPRFGVSCQRWGMD
jgi:hypothetical protein